MATARVHRTRFSQSLVMPSDFSLDEEEFTIRREGRKLILEPIEITQDPETAREDDGAWDIFHPSIQIKKVEPD